MTFNQSCYALQSARGDHPYFVYLLATHAVDQLRSMAHGSVFSTITRQTFDAMSFASPHVAVLDSIEELLSPLFQRIKAAVAENRTLAETRAVAELARLAAMTEPEVKSVFSSIGGGSSGDAFAPGNVHRLGVIDGQLQLGRLLVQLFEASGAHVIALGHRG
jgi:hypothetical protein